MKTWKVLFFLTLVSVATDAWAADEIHWTLTGQTSVTFDWRGTATEHFITYGLAPGALDSKVIANTPSPLPTSSSGPFWEAKLTGLQENTLYYYAIGGGPEHTFITPPPRGSSDFLVYAVGDIGSSLSYSRVVPVHSIIGDVYGNGFPDFALLVGDLSYGDINTAADVDQHFNDVMVWSRDAAYMPAWGNHEWNTSTTLPDHLNNYEGRFDFANSQTSPGTADIIGNGPGEDWYWFDYGNVRFIGYPEPYSGALSDWNGKARLLMDEAQADPAIRYIVTFGHRPAYAESSASSTLKTILDGLGDGHGKYVLNLCGHDHSYERSSPQHGVVHVVVGTGHSSPSTFSTTQPSWSAFRAKQPGALKLRFTDAGITGEFICAPASSLCPAAGFVKDSFALAPAETTPPTVSITNPLAGHTVSGTVAVAADATDGANGSGVAGVQFKLDGSNLGGEDTTAPYAIAWDSTTAAAGPHTLSAQARDNSGNSATDSISVTVNNPTGPPSTPTVEVRVAASSDDAEEQATGGVSLTSSDLELVFDGSNQTVGMRFTGVDIPPGAEIVTAYVQFQVDEPFSDPTSLTIQGQTADNAATFTTATNNISSRPRTTAAVSWAPPPWPTVGQAGPDQRTPNLAAVVQEIVGRAGWSSGDSLVILVTGSGKRTAESFDGTPAGAPLLHVEYRSTGTPQPVITSFSPTSGSVETEVTISGSNFTGATVVTFNGVAASFIVDSDTQIRATVPGGATTGPIGVTTAAGTGVSANGFTVAQPPSGNLLLNPGFELDDTGDTLPDNWINGKSLLTFTRSSEVVAHGGSFVGKHSSSKDVDYIVSQTVGGLTAGRTYNFSGWANIPPTSTDAFQFRFEVQWLKADNANISVTVIKKYTAATSGWDQATASLVAPAGTAKAVVRMFVHSLKRTIYVDDFVFTP